MPKFEICFRDELEAENEEQAIEWLFQYLNDCVRVEDVSAFNIFKIKEKQMAVKKVNQMMVMHWVGSDHDSKEALLGLLVELANGDYTPEQFREDVVDLAGDLNHA